MCKEVGVIVDEGVTRGVKESITVPVNGSKEVLGGSGPRGSHHVLLGCPVG